MNQRTKTYFISDLHLGAKYFDAPLEVEKRAVKFLESIKKDAKALYLMGDILDYWFEYKNVVPRGFTRFFGKLAELSDSGIKITWFIGNHDIWIFDYLPNELGIEVIDGAIERIIDGKKFFLTHGDGVGKLPRPFKAIRTLFRNKFCQKLYSGIHPRWTIPFALAWSNESRKKPVDIEPYKGIDKEPIIIFAKEYLSVHPDIDFFIFGHRHILLDQPLSDRTRAIILGEWIHTCSYAVFDGNELKLSKYI